MSTIKWQLMYRYFFKLFFDFIVALVLLLLFSPIIVSVTIILAFYNFGAVFYFQTRPGRNEKLFKVIKFKSMNDKKDSLGNLLPDSKRLTRFGHFLRKTSFDELPQLFNILKGDMSLVGPRPLLTEYLPLYNETQKKRHLVKPGMTGWAQVNGRNAISWTKKFEYDVWYVENINFVLDIKILLKTVIKVVKSENINAVNAATTTKFLGNSHEWIKGKITNMLNA